MKKRLRSTLVKWIDQTKQRLKIAIEKLPAGDVKKLQGIKDDYRLRVGDLRVIFSVINDTIS